MNGNIIIIQGASKAEVKMVIKDWIKLYQRDLKAGFHMKLYSISDKNHLIDVDPQLDNTRFYFLVNYLIYPKNMNYTVDVTGYTRGLENNILKGKQLMVYIPANDSEYDNVFVCTSENQNFKVDFGGKISPVNQNRIYTIPGLDFYLCRKS